MISFLFTCKKSVRVLRNTQKSHPRVSQTSPWTTVFNCVQVIKWILENPNYSQTLNFLCKRIPFTLNILLELP